jgi:hypothetical protein
MADTEIEGSDLTAIIADELRQAQTFDQSKRTLALQYMRGEMPDLPARPNGSSQTDRTVATTLGWILPQVVRTFTASDQMVEFEATKEGGEKGADEASDYTNYSFFRENDGYRVLYNATYDGLLMGNGAVCSYWCPEEAKTKLFRNKTEEEIAVLLDEGWEPAGVMPTQGKPKPVTLDDGMEVEVPTLTVKLRKVTERGQIKDMTLKPENLMLNLSATVIEEARFVAYLHDDKTRSDLMDMADEYGWDTEVIENLPRYTASTSNEVTIARQRLDQVVNDSAPTKSGDLIDLYECYIFLDRDGDGSAERLQVWYAGNAGQGKALSDEEWEDDVPFTDIPCYPVPHQWQAEGLYDRLADIQRVKTALLRQGLDNTYASTWPMREVEEGSVINPDILVNPKFNGLIWKKKTSAPIVNHVVAYTADKSFVAMQMMDEETTKRTGVGRGTMALDPDVLQNQTATAADNQKDAQVTQSELIARNMAELGWTKWAAKRRNLAKKYIKGSVSIPSKNGDVPPPQMPMEGQEAAPAGKPSGYRTIQPEQWGDEMACTINVGLGTGSRDRDMQMLNNVQMGQIGMAERLGQLPSPTAKKKASEFIPKILKTATQIAESSGLKNPDSYYPEIDETTLQQIQQEIEQGGAQQIDPEVVKAELDAKNKDAQSQRDHEYRMSQAQAKATLDQQAATYANDQKVIQINGELGLKREQLGAELNLKRELGYAELGVDRELGHAGVNANASVKAAASGVHVGGEPG